MESSIAVFLSRRSACERPPTDACTRSWLRCLEPVRMEAFGARRSKRQRTVSGVLRPGHACPGIVCGGAAAAPHSPRTRL